MKISISVDCLIRHRADQELCFFVASNNILAQKMIYDLLVNFQKIGGKEEVYDKDVSSGFLDVMIT